MPATEHDSARPEHLREASRGTEASALALHTSLRSGTSAGNVFTTSPFSGYTADYFQTAIGSINTCLATARDAHEQVAQALRRVADPIEDEQRARRRLNEAREQLAETRERLSDRRTELSAAQGELGAARTDVAVQRGRIATAENANAARIAAGGDPAPIDTSALHEAQRRLQQAERAVREAERLVQRAADRVEDARERTDRARRAHEDAEEVRRTAVHAFAVACRAAAGVLPVVPGAAGPLQLGPRASADSGVEGLSAFARAQLDLLRLKQSIGDDFSKVEVDGSIGGRAEASGGVSIGTDGVRAGVDAGAFAGAEGGVTGSFGSEQTVQASGGASGRLGVGADAHAGVTAQDGKLTIDAGAGLAFGPGVKVGGEVTVNVRGTFESILSFEKNFDNTIGRFLP